MTLDWPWCLPANGISGTSLMRTLILTAFIAFLIDQISKYGVIYGLGLIDSREIAVLPPVLVFQFGYNTGINFGLFGGTSDYARWILIALALAICTALLVWARKGFDRKVQFISAGMVIGGALGNVIDRFFHPGVLDFLNMSCCGIKNPYIFNIADVFIFAGAIGIAIFTGQKKPA
jgi:signal peptidase II